MTNEHVGRVHWNEQFVIVLKWTIRFNPTVDVIEKDFAKLPCIFEAQSSYLFSTEKKKKEKQTKVKHLRIGWNS